MYRAAQAAVVRAGLASSAWQPLDASRTRIAGQTRVRHRGCPRWATASCTRAGNDRRGVRAGLRAGPPRRARRPAEAVASLARPQRAAPTLRGLAPVAQAQAVDESGRAALLARHLPPRGAQAQQGLRDATAVAASPALAGFPLVQRLVGDDAPQGTGVTADRARCGIDAGRHGQKRRPSVAAPRTRRAAFRPPCWAGVRGAHRSGAAPRRAAARLAAACDPRCATQTGAVARADRRTVTRAHQAPPLRVLAHPSHAPASLQPERPVHTNPAACGAQPRRPCWPADGGGGTRLGHLRGAGGERHEAGRPPACAGCRPRAPDRARAPARRPDHPAGRSAPPRRSKGG